MEDKIIYVKGHALKIYSDDYVRQNGKKCDEITIGYGGVGGQYVYLNTSDSNGYELPVSGLVYEEYSDGRIQYYTTCNSAGLPCTCDSAEYNDDGSLHDAAFYNYDEDYGVSVVYDQNGNSSSEELFTPEFNEHTFFNSDGTRMSERYWDSINNIHYHVTYNNEEISEAIYEYREDNWTKTKHFDIRENSIISMVSNVGKGSTFRWDITDVSEENGCTIIRFSKVIEHIKLENYKRVWNKEGFLTCKHELIDTDLTFFSKKPPPLSELYERRWGRMSLHGVYWDDNGVLKKEYFCVSEMLIELIYDETENILDQTFYYKNKFYPGHVKINNTDKIISYIDDQGNKVINIKHSNHVTAFSADIDENNINIMLNTLRPDEKAFSVADAPKDTRGFVEYLLEKTEKFW